MRLTSLAPAFLLAFLLAFLGLGACSPGTAISRIPGCSLITSSKIGGPFSLTSNKGAHLTEASFKARKTIVFFGYTYCPDFCPRTLGALGTAMRLLPKDVKPPVTAFISVDPARDTPEQLTAYIASNGFPQDIVGMTGTSDELEAVSKAFAAPFERSEDPDSATGYTVSHTTTLYLMDENWKLLSVFTGDTRPQDMAKCIAALSH